MSNQRRRHSSNIGIILVAVLFLLVAIGTVTFAFKDVWFQAKPTPNPETTDPGKPEEPKKPETADEFKAARAKLLEEADLLQKGYYYDEAARLLSKDAALTDETVTAKLAEVQAAKAALTVYDGPLEHAFFHSLIIYPELAFDAKGHPAEGYNMWMTTVKEFKAMLPQMLARGYVLVDITQTAEYSAAEGKWVKKDLLLPPGKRPLIISQDDVNYYPYMEPDGFASRLVIDTDGQVATEVKSPTGEVSVTRDGDVLPILDDFVKEHPEFSYRGAKGILAVTGFSGVFGYRTTDPEDYTPEENAKMHAAVQEIAAAVKATGWKIASHSYTHNGYFRDLTVTMDQMAYDTDRWTRDVACDVGETNIHISPFGYRLKDEDPRYRYLIEKGGFNFFCFVGSGETVYYHNDNVMMPRINLDGFTMTKNPDYINERFYNVSEVLDPARPPLNLP